MSRSVLLVNTNTVRPPVSPVGLEYVAEAAIERGIDVRVLDFSFEIDWKAALKRELHDKEPLMVGLTVRNTDDCSSISRKSFVPWIAEVVAETKRLTEAPVFVGGGGFSVMPELVLAATQADGGIEGDGEEALPALVKALQEGNDLSNLPNLVYRRGQRVIRNQRADADLGRLPRRRRVFDNRRYEQTGAMVGIETKRGCTGRCIFCADPVSKGSSIRLRPPALVAQEFQGLVDQGVTYFHLCDSEFNLPVDHAKDVCRAIIEKGLSGRIRWYTYCSPIPFDAELVELMKASGCAGINFGVDSLCDGQLGRLGRVHLLADIARLVSLLNAGGINYMFDLLIGGPGETPQMVAATIDEVRKLNVPLVGVSVGVRVYPGTLLAQTIAAGEVQAYPNRDAGESPARPVFYMSPALGDNAVSLIAELTGDDPRFLLLARPDEKGSYNYAGDEALTKLIEKGARGAYWDILRKNRL